MQHLELEGLLLVPDTAVLATDLLSIPAFASVMDTVGELDLSHLSFHSEEIDEDIDDEDEDDEDYDDEDDDEDFDDEDEDDEEEEEEEEIKKKKKK